MDESQIRSTIYDLIEAEHDLSRNADKTDFSSVEDLVGRAAAQGRAIEARKKAEDLVLSDVLPDGSSVRIVYEGGRQDLAGKRARISARGGSIKVELGE